MLKFAVFSGLCLTLTLTASTAQAQVWCGVQNEVNIASEPTPGKWYRLTGADAKAARKAKKPLLEQVFGDQAENVMRASRMDEKSAQVGKLMCVPVVKPGELWTPMPAFYEPAKDEAQYTLVDLEQQFLGAYEYGRLVFSHPIASSKYKSGKVTPTGDFKILRKDKYHASTIYRDDSGRPFPMPYALKFYETRRKGGGDIWGHQGTLPGKPASHGCIRQRMKDAIRMFEWVKLGTTFRIVPHL